MKFKFKFKFFFYIQNFNNFLQFKLNKFYFDNMENSFNTEKFYEMSMSNYFSE